MLSYATYKLYYLHNITTLTDTCIRYSDTKTNGKITTFFYIQKKTKSF